MPSMHLRQWEPGMSRSDLITISEAAKILGCKVQTLRRKVREGRISAYRPMIGVGALVARRDIERYAGVDGDE